MKPVTVSTTIGADPDRVYAAVIDIERLPKTSPDTVAITFLGDQRTGAGTRFRETRSMGKQTADFDLELAECDAQARTARFISDMDGTVWDTRMQVIAQGDGSHVSFTMEAHTKSVIKRAIFGLMRGVFRKAMDRQVQALKRYCERPA